MGAAFSQDIRDRVIRAREDQGNTRQEVAEDLQVSVWYVDSVMKRRRTTGERTAQARNGGRRRVLACTRIGSRRKWSDNRM